MIAMHATPRFNRIGLTGGIAAGKSSVAELWRERGVTVIDTDALAHASLAPGTATHAAIVDRFGPGIRQADGTINRTALGAIVFADEAQRQGLNAIVHPPVRQQWQAALAALEQDGHTAAAIVMIPLLFEVGLEEDFDTVVVTACSAATQITRLAGKGLNTAQAQARIGAQWPMQTKMDRADYVIWNDGSRRLLAAQAEMIWERIKETDHAPRPT